MKLPSIRLWVEFYLIVFVLLLWAVFLSTQGTMFWVSLICVIVVIAINFLMLIREIKKYSVRAGIQQNLTREMHVGKKPR